MRCSVAMSTYNGAAYLAEQLDSIFAQTRPVDEIVISDDCSTDQTLAIVGDFQTKHPEIHWVVLPAEKNQGFRASFRRALTHCSGDLILLCDQDDRWTKEKAAKIEAIFEKNPKVQALVTDFKTIDAKGRFLNPEAKTENLWVSDRVLRSGEKPAQITLREMLGRNQGQGCAMALRREIAEAYISLGTVWTHDWILNLIAAMRGGLYYCDEQLIHYRLHGANVIGMAQGEHAQRKVGLVRRAYEYALAFKYSFLEGDGKAARESLLSVTMDKLELVFSRLACGDAERSQWETWRAFQDKRLALIEKKKPFSYLLFWLTHRELFAENAYFSTTEQRAIRLMLDLCAMLKKQ